jgi:hypothetical protein
VGQRLRPLLLLLVVMAWYVDPTNEMTYLYAIIGAQLILGVIEHYLRARPERIIRARQKTFNVILAFCLTLVAPVHGDLYVNG